jgi:hypothetical protein
MSRIYVPHWGVHWAPGGLAYLHQARGDTNAIGVKEPSPFAVRVASRGAVCNHLVQLNALNPAREHMDLFRAVLMGDALARFMLPIPTIKGEPWAAMTRLPDPPGVTLLTKLSSPIRKPILWADFTTPKVVSMALEETNIQPLVLMGVKIAHMRMIETILRSTVEPARRLLIVPAPDVPLGLPDLDAPKMRSHDARELLTLPWETLGAVVLRAYMRREWNIENVWFTREPTPANEAKPSRPMPHHSG